MLAQGLKHLYTSGLHHLAPRPSFLRLACQASQLQYSSALYSAQLVPFLLFSSSLFFLIMLICK